jgi:RHH-type transcriptional regulator, proline utilization regulon repressor / proline dehydrogenase / delta 1-pyrroline-5-carboxylate dehydrogenase
LIAGNLYINRSTTGAVVLRQPFGGMGKSAFGPGIKAGGPNYVVPLMEFASIEDGPAASSENNGENVVTAPELESLSAFWQLLNDEDNADSKRLQDQFTADQWSALRSALVDYDRFATSEIRQKHDTLRLIGQDNFRLYQPMTHIRIRVSDSDSWLSIIARAAAVIAVGGRATLSHADGVHEDSLNLLEALTGEWAADLEFVEESDDELVEAIREGQVDRVRYAAPANVPLAVRQAADEQFIYVADAPVSPCGRVELLWYVREQSLCVDYHRYGNLGFRATESRSEPA